MQVIFNLTGPSAEKKYIKKPQFAAQSIVEFIRALSFYFMISKS